MLTRLLLIVLGSFVLLQILARVFRKLVHFPSPAYIGRFLDSSLRKFLQSPEKLIQRSGIEKGMHLLEVGCGSGAFTTCAARTVGEGGAVLALDIQMGMLKQLQRKLAQRNSRAIRNIKLINASASDLPLDGECVDLVYMVTVLQEIPDPHRALQEAHRVLKRGGLLAVTEFLPDPDYPLRSTTIKMGQKAGFVLEQIRGAFWNYTVKFVKPPGEKHGP